jgi:hypothetical protein
MVIVRNKSHTRDKPMQAPVQNQGSASERFTGVMGTTFVVPEGFIQLDENPSIGYQYTFWHADYEVRIVVYEIAPGYIPVGAYEWYDVIEKLPNILVNFSIDYSSFVYLQLDVFGNYLSGQLIYIICNPLA